MFQFDRFIQHVISPAKDFKRTDWTVRTYITCLEPSLLHPDARATCGCVCVEVACVLGWCVCVRCHGCCLWWCVYRKKESFSRINFSLRENEGKYFHDSSCTNLASSQSNALQEVRAPPRERRGRVLLYISCALASNMFGGFWGLFFFGLVCLVSVTSGANVRVRERNKITLWEIWSSCCSGDVYEMDFVFLYIYIESRLDLGMCRHHRVLCSHRLGCKAYKRRTSVHDDFGTRLHVTHVPDCSPALMSL